MNLMYIGDKYVNIENVLSVEPGKFNGRDILTFHLADGSGVRSRPGWDEHALDELMRTDKAKIIPADSGTTAIVLTYWSEGEGPLQFDVWMHPVMGWEMSPNYEGGYFPVPITQEDTVPRSSWHPDAQMKHSSGIDWVYMFTYHPTQKIITGNHDLLGTCFVGADSALDAHHQICKLAEPHKDYLTSTTKSPSIVGGK